MIKRGLTKGFTIVELLIVIIVVAVLATLIALSYGNAQSQARDTQIRDAADKFADAIKVIQVRTGAFPQGGAGSTTPVDATNGCVNGSGGFQAPAVSGVVCTIGDAVVAMGLLPASQFTNVPTNGLGGSTTQVFMVYTCGGKNYLFYTLEKPTTDESTNFTNVKATCDAATQTALTNANANMQAAEDLSVL